MSYKVTLRGEALVLHLGKLSFSEPDLSDIYRRLPGYISKGYKKIVVDTSAMQYVVSQGIGAMVRINDIAEQHGADVVFATPSEKMLSVLKVMNLREVLRVVLDVKSACEKFGVTEVVEKSLEDVVVEHQDAASPAGSAAPAVPAASVNPPAAPRPAPTIPTAYTPPPPSPSPPPPPPRPPVSSAPEPPRPAFRPISTSSDNAEDMAEVEKFAKKYVRSFMHQQILEMIATKNTTILSPKDVAKNLGVKSKDADAVLRELTFLRLMKVVGSSTYNYSPPVGFHESLIKFLRAWRNPHQHAKLMKLVLK